MDETCFDHLAGAKTASISTGERIVKNKLSKLAEKYPDLVELVSENHDGSAMYHIPWNWVKISPPRKMNLTEERRAELSERMKNIRNKV